jgi:hypothetical protein
MITLSVIMLSVVAPNKSTKNDFEFKIGSYYDWFQVGQSYKTFYSSSSPTLGKNKLDHLSTAKLLV